MADGVNFGGVDWCQPWFEPYRDLGEALTKSIKINGLHTALNDQSGLQGLTMRFVDEHALPPGTAYEQFVFNTHLVPTRHNLHDAFNALVWLRYPALKTALNALQAAQLAVQKPGDPRGPVRDAVTVFDENGAFLLDAIPPIWQALCRHEWPVALHEHRDWWLEKPRLRIVGHALLEKLCSPRKAMVAHVLQLASTDLDLQGAERIAAEFVSPATQSKRYQPLPVLGIAGWHSDNAELGFYADQSVFRTLRTT